MHTACTSPFSRTVIPNRVSLEIMVPDVEHDMLNKERPAELVTGCEDELGTDAATKREDGVDKLVVVVESGEVVDVTIAAGGEVQVLGAVKKVGDGVMIVLGEEMGLLGEVMLVVWRELSVIDGVDAVDQVVVVLIGVLMVLGL